jgi:AcrR family transcriptional regulator
VEQVLAKRLKSNEFQRARSADQKEERRQDILRAARGHLAEVGLDGFSMGPLAKAAGVARATLYLYYPTREEVLLAIYSDAAEAWVDEVLAETPEGTSADELLSVFFDTLMASAEFREIAPDLSSVVEANISTDSLIQTKRLGAGVAARLGARLSTLFGLPPDDAQLLFNTLFASLVGLSRVLRRPDVDVVALPEDVQQVIAELDAREAFLRAGRWMIEGARAQATLPQEG